MNEYIKAKLEPVFNGLLRKGIDPDAMANNQVFLGCMKQYADGDMDIFAIISCAEKINILAGGKYSEKQQMKA